MNVRLSMTLLLNITGLILFLSWYSFANHGFWFSLDSEIFYFFNRQLIKSRTFLWLIALTNNRAFDVVSLLSMSTLVFFFWSRTGTEGRKRILIICFVMLLVTILTNQLMKVIFPLNRLSPTLFFINIYRVSELLCISTKDTSKASFPGDHGTILLIFSGFMLRYFGRKAFLISIIIFITFALPRIIIGAHWFTDVIVGSLSTVLIILPWFLIMPISDGIISVFDRYLFKKYKNSL